MSTSRKIDYKPRSERTGLPLIEVRCPGCLARFTTAAKTHTTCPDCGKDFRVHRSTRPRAASVERQRNTAQPVRQDPDHVRQPAVLPGISAAPPAPRTTFVLPVVMSRIPALPTIAVADDDSDPWAYTFDRGRLVLAEQHDGYVLPAVRLPAEWLAGQLAGRGWTLKSHGTGMCQVIRLMRGAGDVADWIEECHGRAEHEDPPLCRYCFGELQAPYDL